MSLMLRPMARGVVMALAAAGMLAAAPAPRAAEEPPARPAGPTTYVFIENRQFPCRILKHDEKTLTVLLTEADTPVSIAWASLTESEQRRLRALIGAGQPAPIKPGGREIDGVEVTLATGAVYCGVELADRATATHRAFRFKNVPFMAIVRKDIRSVRPINIDESEIYPPQERYRKLLAAKPPQAAPDYLVLGDWCRDNGLVEEARDNYQKCVLLDAAYAERCNARLAALPNPGGRPALPGPGKQSPEELRREVLWRWPTYLDHFILKCAVARISETPAVPFKVVHLTTGMTFEGVLKSGENDDEMLLENAGRTYSVKRELIARVEQKLVEPGPWRDRTLAEARQYVTDPKGGISADVLAAVTKDLGIADKEALDIWNARLNEAVAVGPDGIKAPRQEAPSHQARWGTGSWLRGTGAGGSGAAGAVQPRAGGAGTGPQQQWPSPEDWWKAQPPAVKAGILRAMCAEALMKVDKVFEEPCSNCGGSGQLEVLVTGVGGNTVRKDPCPVCRGGGKFYGVTYR